MATELDLFVQGDSGIHRMDPRLKLLGFCFFVTATALVSSLYAACTALAISICCVIYIRIPLSLIFRRIRMAVIFLAAFFLILPFSHPLGTRAGVAQAVIILFKGTAMLLTIFPMFGTNRFDLSMKALEQLKVSPKFVALIFFTYRYIGAYSDQLKTLRMSLQCRGFKPKADVATLKTMGGLTGSLLVRSFDQTERIYRAMVSRGFSGHFVTLHEFSPMGRTDGYRFGILFVISIGLILIDQAAKGSLPWIR